MNNNHIHPEDEYLKIYCHYPLTMATEEYNSSRNHRYQITTIETDEIDPDYVPKNIYEMTLEGFLNWYLDLHNEEIVSIEKLTE